MRYANIMLIGLNALLYSTGCSRNMACDVIVRASTQPAKQSCENIDGEMDKCIGVDIGINNEMLVHYRGKRALLKFAEIMSQKKSNKLLSRWNDPSEFHYLYGKASDGQDLIIAGYGMLDSYVFNQGVRLCPSIVLLNDLLVSDTCSLGWSTGMFPGGGYASIIVIVLNMPQLGVFQASGILSEGKEQVILEHIGTDRKVLVSAKHNSMSYVVVEWRGAKRQVDGPLGRWVWFYDEDKEVIEMTLMPNGKIFISEVSKKGREIGFLIKIVTNETQE